MNMKKIPIIGAIPPLNTDDAHIWNGSWTRQINSTPTSEVTPITIQ